MLRRGDVVLARFGQQGSVPVVVLSEGIFNQRAGTVIAVILTRASGGAGYPLSYTLTSKIGNEQLSAKMSQIHTIAAQHLGQTIGHVESHDLQNILDGLSEIISG